jgi:hypothetical protein
MAAIVGEKGEVLTKGGGADQEVAISDHQASRSQTATFFAKDFDTVAGLLSQGEPLRA